MTLKLYLLFGGLILALCVLVSLYWMQIGIEQLFDGRGQDIVEAGYNLGELFVHETRHIVIRPSGVLQLLQGAVLLIGSLTLYRVGERRLQQK
jgi:hypothetical protein